MDIRNYERCDMLKAWRKKKTMLRKVRSSLLTLTLAPYGGRETKLLSQSKPRSPGKNSLEVSVTGESMVLTNLKFSGGGIWL
jgi:hypothetical protein